MAKKVKKNSLNQQLPQHIALIMDGNRRWAKKHGLQIIQGHHKVATEVIQELADKCIELGVKYLTLWAFSTHNWHREPVEVELMMELFREVLAKNIDRLHQKGIRVKTIGDLSRFEPDIREKIAQGVAKTKNNHNLTLTFALNYGGRDELTRAVKKIGGQMEVGQLKAAEITQALIAANLDTSGLPEPDLLIRPGGEKRLSGFLLWQCEYSELYFSDILMPDFGAGELEKAIQAYQRRARRFGR